MNESKVLFVDDEQHILEEYKELFEKNPIDVITMNNPLEALDVISSESIEVIVSDYKMPEMTGLELLLKTKKISPNTARMILTGYADKEMVLRAYNDGQVYRFLEKPCPPDELIEAVQMALTFYKESVDIANLIGIDKTYSDSASFDEKLQERVREQKSEVEMLSHEVKILEVQRDSNSKLLFKGLVNMIQIRMNYLKRLDIHGKRVWTANFSNEIAKKMNLPNDDQSKIYMAAYLGDIGIIVFPDSVIQKNMETLTPKEKILYMQFPKISEDILKSAGFNDLAKIASNLLERYDGSGPKGKTGEEIPVHSQILMLAEDAYKILFRRQRRYSSKETVYVMASITEHIRNNIKRLYDKEVCKAALSVIMDIIKGNHPELTNL